jgi:single-stranded DNA-binding protein
MPRKKIERVPNINMVAVDGNLCEEPVVRNRKEDNQPIVFFRLATHPRQFRKNPTYDKLSRPRRVTVTYIPCVAYPDTGMAQFLQDRIERELFTKGSYCFVYGGLLWYQYRGTNGWVKTLNVVVERVAFSEFQPTRRHQEAAMEVAESRIDPEVGF